VTGQKAFVKSKQRKMDMVQKPALLVIDMQNDFVEDDGWLSKARGYPYTPEQKSKLYQTCRTLIERAHDLNVPVIYARTVLRADRLDSAFPLKIDRRHRRGPPYLVEGTWGAQIVEALTPEPRDIFIQKTGYSTFHFTPLLRILKNLAVDSLILVGGPLYESVNATGRDGAAYGYVPFAVPEGLYPVDYPNPQFLRMRMHIISTSEALERLRKTGELEQNYKYHPEVDWHALLPQSCLLLVDLQNGFVRRGGVFTGRHELWPEFVYREEDYRSLLMNNAKLIKWAHKLSLPVINVRGLIRSDGIDSALYPDSQRASVGNARGCIVGDWNGEFAEEIMPTLNDIELIKHGHSGFAFTILDRMLSNLGIEQCIVTGGNVAGCLEETVRDGNALGYSMVVVRDATYRPDDPRLDLIANECEIVRTNEILTAPSLL